MSKLRFSILAGLAVAAGVAAAVWLAPRWQGKLRRPPGMHAMWAERYLSLGQMAHSADAVVVATVEATRAGRAVPTRASVLPFTLVDLRVQRAVRGELGSSLTVEQTGGDTRGRTVYIDGDGGPYDRGQQVLLFLKRQPESGYYYLVNPQGRFIVVRGRLAAVSADDPVAAQLHGRGLEEALRLIAAAR